MRRLWWVLAVVLSLALWAHYSADQTLIEQCQADFSYAEHVCISELAEHSELTGEFDPEENGFLQHHVGLVAIAAFSVVFSMCTVIFGVVNAPKPRKRLLMIDNYDSFTYNLVQYFGELGVEVIVKRNDEISFADIEGLQVDYIVISPGPCTPNESGISLEIIQKLAGKLPILGVCLGHQAIAQVYGGQVVKADKVMHGKTSWVYHENSGVFKGLEAPFQATRYHSLVVDKASFDEALADDFELTAWTESEELGHDGEFEYIMGMKHKHLPLEGVQFHPESILSEQGHDLLKNFLLYNEDFASQFEVVPKSMIEKGAIR